MIKLEDKANVDAPTVQFPFGDVRDKTLLLAGTKWNKEQMSDAMQFFAKMMDASGIAPNGVLDDFNNGFQLFEAMKRVNRPYKKYIALMTQNGANPGNPPTANILENDLGAIVWSQSGVGSYKGTLAGAFVAGKTWMICNTGLPGGFEFALIKGGFPPNEVALTSRNGGVPTDSIMTDLEIEIRVYY